MTDLSPEQWETLASDVCVGFGIRALPLTARPQPNTAIPCDICAAPTFTETCAYCQAVIARIDADPDTSPDGLVHCWPRCTNPQPERTDRG